MGLNLAMVIVIILFGSIAAFIDSVIGGSGLVSTPALLAIGLSPSVVLGTNKLASLFGSLTSTTRPIRSGKVDLYVVAKLFDFIFSTSACGIYIAMTVPSRILKPLIIIVPSPVSISALLKKDWGNTHTFTQLTFKKAMIFATLSILVGSYDKFIDGGTGSFILSILLVFGLDFLSTAGNTKVLSFASNIGTLVLFMVLGQVDYVVGLIMAMSMITGSCVGARFAIKQGVGYVKVLFIIITAILALKSAFDYI